MASMRDQLARAVKADDLATIVRLVDLLRAYGYDYMDTYHAATRAVPGLTLARWDAIMYAADELGQGWPEELDR